MFDSVRTTALQYMFPLLMFLFVSGVSSAQDVATTPDPVLVALDARVSQFLEGVSMGQAQSAFSELLAGSQLLKQGDILKEVIEKANELKSKYGRYRAFEKISAKRIGGDLVLMKYLYKCENFPVVWYLTFYRTPSPGEPTAESDTWRVIAVRFDTNLDLLGF